MNQLDEHLIIELSKNCRVPIKQLASKFKKPRSTISYHLEQLKKNGVIKSCNALIDQKYLGIIYARVEIKFSQIDNEKITKLEEFLKHNSFIRFFARLQGNADFAIAIYVTRIAQLYEVICSIKKFLSGYIERLDFSLGHKVYHCFPRVFYGEDIKPVPINYEVGKQIDETDTALIKILHENGASSILDIAKSLNMDTRTVLARKKKLEESVILRYSADIDFQKLGFQSHHVFWRLYNHDRLEEFKQMLLSHPNVRYVTEVIGDNSSIDCEFIVKEIGMLYRLLQEIREEYSDSIQSHDSFTMMTTHSHF